MTLEEIRALIPKNAEIVEFKPDARYVITIKRAAFPEGYIKKLGDALYGMGIKCVIMLVHEDIEEPLTAHELMP